MSRDDPWGPLPNLHSPVGKGIAFPADPGRAAKSCRRRRNNIGRACSYRLGREEIHMTTCWRMVYRGQDRLTLP
eukprot:5600952-Prymnesium_polylepis.2